MRKCVLKSKTRNGKVDPTGGLVKFKSSRMIPGQYLVIAEYNTRVVVVRLNKADLAKLHRAIGKDLAK